MEHDAYRSAANRGFTLIEIVITIVILGAVSGILVPFFNAIIHSPDPVIRERAISLGQAMMDEIMAKKWDKNTPVGGGPVITGETVAASGTTCILEPFSCTGNRIYCFVCRNPDYAVPTASDIKAEAVYVGTGRVNFDAVDDYNGLNETNTFIDQNGKTTTLTGYQREVAVRYIPSSSDPITQDLLTTGSLVNKTDTKLVVVTITSPLGEKFYFVAVACNI